MYIDYNYVINLNNYNHGNGKKIKNSCGYICTITSFVTTWNGGQMVKDFFYGYRGEGSNFATNILWLQKKLMSSWEQGIIFMI